MYQFLIGGEISEVYGKYAPRGIDAHRIEFEIRGKRIPAVLFVVETARRKGYLRACAIPLDPRFEPWAKPLLDWFEDHGERCPFMLNEKITPKSNQRYAQKKAEEIFKDLKWPMGEYWSTRSGKKVGMRYNPFTPSSLRGLRRKNLKEFYHFNERDLAIFGAWNEPVVDPQLKSEIKNIFSMKLKKKDITKKLSEEYFEKLLWPISELDKEYDVISHARSYRISKMRDERAMKIVKLILQTNILFEGKVGPKLFLENNLRIVTDFLTSCETESEFITKIARLGALFDVNLKPLKQLVKEPEQKRSIVLVEQWLQENGIKYDPDMIKTWINIRKLRNMEPIHPRINAKELMRILDFFGMEKSLPFDPSAFWDSILDKFQESLEKWQEILNRL